MKFAHLVLSALLAAAASGTATAQGATAAGARLDPSTFHPVELARSFPNDRVRDALGYDESGPVRGFDLDLDGDGRPERFVAGAPGRCGDHACPFALLDGKSRREIGQFSGILVVLDRRERGWRVVQTLGAADEAGMSNVTTYTFERLQYQPDDATLVDAAGRDAMLRGLRRLP